MKQEVLKKIDKTRCDNLLVLIDIIGGTIQELADKTGVHRSTLSAIVHGKPMLPSHARQIENNLGKPFGWMDRLHDEDEIYPLYSKDALSAAIKCLYSAQKITRLYNSLDVDGKTDFLDKLYNIFTDPVARELSTKTILRMLGVENEINSNKNKKANDRTKADT